MHPAYANPSQLTRILGHSPRYWRARAACGDVAYHRAAGQRTTIWIDVASAREYVDGLNVQPVLMSVRARLDGLSKQLRETA